nr:bromodomain and WD repeat-containing protein 3 [Parasteatoda tepidariorum]
MPAETENSRRITTLESELYLLIAKFLKTGPCQESAKILREEIEKHELLPKRIDWLGNEHNRTFNEFDNILSRIADDHLLKICERIGPILDKEIPPTVPGLTSLLGVGRQSFLRTKEDLQKPRCQSSNLIARKNGMPLLPSQAAQSTYPPNIAQVLMSRELSGSLSCAHTFTPKVYARQQNYRRLLGHLSSVYCVLFDRTGKYIFTGADDLLVKIWCATDGRLLATLRGHSAEITDMAVNYENTLLAAGSCDKTIRVWCLRTTAPVAVLNAHTGMVTSLQFCPYPKKEDHLLISTGNDGCVCFWQWNPKNNTFNPKPLKFTERNKPNAQMLCTAFSKGGLFLATGSTDHNVRVYNIAGSNGPEKILEREAHTDRVDSLQFSNSDCRFITGSKDGTASIWQYKKQNWTSIQLKMTTKLPGTQSDEPEDTKVKLRVTMVGWTLDDSRVITAVSDFTIKIWDSNSGNLRFILKGHEDEVFVLEPHPIDPRIFLSSGHDGRIILWDLVTGTVIKNHFNLIEGQGHGAVFDCKFSPDGLMFASTDSHGHLSIFGFGSADRYKKVPEEQFFHTDYRPLIRDIHHHVLDEQTQTAPHLLPPPFLVDIDGNPYPPQFQRLVPGREYCNDSQLVPYVAVSANGEAEILEPVRSANDIPSNRPTIDDMIERLQQEQNQNNRDNSSESGSRRGPPDSPNSSRRGHSESEQNGVPDPFSPRTPRSQAAHSRVGLRRTGDVEGVQSVGNWQSRGNQPDMQCTSKRYVVRPIKQSMANSLMKTRVTLAEHEMNLYNQERKWRPQPESSRKSQMEADNLSWLKRPGLRAGTRARTQEDAINNAFGEEFENPENVPSSPATETEQEEEEEKEDTFTDSSNDSGSGEYSDWEAESSKKTKKYERTEPSENEPSSSGLSSRARSARRRRRRALSDEEHGESEENDDDDDDMDDDESSKSPPKTPRKTKSKVSHKGKMPATKGKKLPERFRPPEWLTDVMPHKAPYVPQIGDEIMYFRQGHELYVQAVKRNRAYDIYMRDQPWRKYNIRDQEVAIIEDITFENHPPRLCCLKLALSNPATKLAETFTVKYHDMEDVIEFIILKQNYDTAMYYDWKPGDRFRSAIDKAWWLGTIKAQKPLNPLFPDSMFQCFLVKWDNGEREQMSPWDFERIDAERLPAVEGGSVDITPEERLNMMYIAEPHEWSAFGRDYDNDRLASGFTRIMELSIAEPFTTPVDLNVYPAYAIVVEYPMDLGTIKARLQNRFYRRLAALKFDVQYIGINALKFNEPTSRIVKQAKCVVELCLKFIGLPNCHDPMIIYHEMMEAKQSRSQDSQSELDVLCSESDSDGEHNAKIKRRKRNAMQSSTQMHKSNQKYTSSSWREQCMSLLNTMFEWNDSTPFRYPVNLNDYPNYRDIIDCPMDLSTVRDRLSNNYYSSPTGLCKDVRLIFQNSRTYNINKKSRIYSMTIRLSAMFEEHIRGIVSDWKSAVKYEEKIRNNQYVSSRRKPLPVQDANVNVGASTSRGFTSNLPSTSRADNYKTSINRILNAAYSEPSSSRSKMKNGIGRKKKSSPEVTPTKQSTAGVKKKVLKTSLGTLTNGVAKKKFTHTSKRTFVNKSLRRRTENVHKKEHSSFEGSRSDSEAGNESNKSSDSDSDDSEWGNNRSKKRPKDNSESEESVFRNRSKRPRKAQILHTKRTFRNRIIKKHLRHTRSTRSSAHLKSPVFSSRISKTLNSAPDSSRSITPERTKKSFVKSKRRDIPCPLQSPLASKRLQLRSKNNSPPSKRAHLRRVTVQPRRYVNSGTTSESDASELQSNKDDSTSNSQTASNSRDSSSKLSSARNTSTNSAAVDEMHYSSSSETEEQTKTARQLPKRISRRALLLPSPRQTRNRGQRTVQYGEDSNDDNVSDDSGNSQPLLSLSSRGRLRSDLTKDKNIAKPVMTKKVHEKTPVKECTKRSILITQKQCKDSELSSKLRTQNVSKLKSRVTNTFQKRRSSALLSHKFDSHSSLRSRSSTSLDVNKIYKAKSTPTSSKTIVQPVESKLYQKALKICDKRKISKSLNANNGEQFAFNGPIQKKISNASTILRKSSNIKIDRDKRLTRSSLSSNNTDKSDTASKVRLKNNEASFNAINNLNKNSKTSEDKPSSTEEGANKIGDIPGKINNPKKVQLVIKRKPPLLKHRKSGLIAKKLSKTLASESISSYTRSAVHKEASPASKSETSSSTSDLRKTKDEDVVYPSTSKKIDESECSNQSKENSSSAATKRKWYQKKIRSAARISTRVNRNSSSTSKNVINKRETRYSGRRTVIYTEDIDSPYLMEMLENEEHYESDISQNKDISTSTISVPLSKPALSNPRQRQSYVRVRHKPNNFKRYSLRAPEEAKKPLKQLSNGIETRNRGERTMLYNDDSEFSDEFENLEPVVFNRSSCC